MQLQTKVIFVERIEAREEEERERQGERERQTDRGRERKIAVLATQRVWVRLRGC